MNINYSFKNAEVNNPQFDYAGRFSEELALVRIGDYGEGKYGFIDAKGNFVINPQFDHAESFQPIPRLR